MSANRKSSRFNGQYALASLLAFWWILSIIIGQGFLPPPHVAAVEFLNLLREGNLLRHSMASFLRLAGGIAGASLLGLPLGIALGTSRRVDRLLSPLLYILYPLPKIAFLPLFLLLFGLGNASKIVLLFTVMFFQIVLAVRDGLSNLPVEYRRVADSLNIGRRRRFATLYLPAALPGTVRRPADIRRNRDGGIVFCRELRHRLGAGVSGDEQLDHGELSSDVRGHHRPGTGSRRVHPACGSGAESALPVAR
jgi:ABC-type nitrate/sulfonate/bicarbonate transport system permease component